MDGEPVAGQLLVWVSEELWVENGCLVNLLVGHIDWGLTWGWGHRGDRSPEGRCWDRWRRVPGWRLD
jgi:hypothetical protein